MKRFGLILISIFGCLFIMSCAPVLRKDIMKSAIRDVPLSEVKKKPDIYMGKLFVIGGIIVNTRATSEGSLIKALYIPVDSRGYMKSSGVSQTRFFALLPKAEGLLDPVIFRRNMEITLAGEFAGIREGKIDEMQFGFPFFIIKDIYLWEEREYFPSYYYGPFPYRWRPYW